MNVCFNASNSRYRYIKTYVKKKSQTSTYGILFITKTESFLYLTFNQCFSIIKDILSPGLIHSIHYVRNQIR